ncbi:MAG: hypothetical protein MPL62_16640, partial [Alphaproteobacteria bacterium]|nr:hypothetical protein [Alphaproteobacteria bacterium]
MLLLVAIAGQETHAQVKLALGDPTAGTANTDGSAAPAQTPVTMVDVTSITAADATAADGSTVISDARVFKMDMLVAASANQAGINYGVYVDSSQVELIAIEDPSPAGLSAPSTIPPITDVSAASDATFLGVTWNEMYQFTWSAVTPLPFIKVSAGVDEYVKVATLTFAYKLAGGNAQIGVWRASGVSGTHTSDSLITIVGPAVPQNANLTLAFGTDGAGAGLPNDHKASAERATQAQGAAGTSIEVTCNLTDNDG